MLKSLSMPVRLLMLVALAVAAYVILAPADDAPGKKVSRPTRAKSVRKGEVTYLEEDYKAKFQPVAATIKDAFKPVVAKAVNAKAAALTLNVIPATFAGGEANWMFTGSADVDGVLQALIENRVTGEGVFLRVGDIWKGVSVEEITEDSVLLASPETGTEKRLTLPAEDTPTTGPAGFTPAQVGNAPLRGNIGPLTAQPDPNAQDNFTGTGNNAGNGFNSGGFGRRRGGRRTGGGATGG